MDDACEEIVKCDEPLEHHQTNPECVVLQEYREIQQRGMRLNKPVEDIFWALHRLCCRFKIHHQVLTLKQTKIHSVLIHREEQRQVIQATNPVDFIEELVSISKKIHDDPQEVKNRRLNYEMSIRCQNTLHPSKDDKTKLS